MYFGSMSPPTHEAQAPRAHCGQQPRRRLGDGKERQAGRLVEAAGESGTAAGGVELVDDAVAVVQLEEIPVGVEGQACRETGPGREDRFISIWGKLVDRAVAIPHEQVSMRVERQAERSVQTGGNG